MTHTHHLDTASKHTIMQTTDSIRVPRIGTVTQQPPLHSRRASQLVAANGLQPRAKCYNRIRTPYRMTGSNGVHEQQKYQCLEGTQLIIVISLSLMLAHWDLYRHGIFRRPTSAAIPLRPLLSEVGPIN